MLFAIFIWDGMSATEDRRAKKENQGTLDSLIQYVSRNIEYDWNIYSFN